MIERVARAICVADGVDPDAIGFGMGRVMPSGAKYGLWEARVKQAKAAIDAIREPTTEMEKAGISTTPMGERYTWNARSVYQAMIDKALKP